MSSWIYPATVWHQRARPKIHEFRHSLFFVGFDLSELEELDKHVNFFGYNRFSLLGLYDEDYLPGRQGSIREKLLSFLEEVGISANIERLELITVPRVVRKVFNPVSFYRCFDSDGLLCCAVAEVNNTFGETHLYLLDQPLDGGAPSQVRYQACKEFHVSPFNDREGDYRFSFSRAEDELDIRVNILRDGAAVFMSRIQGKAIPFSLKNVITTVLAFPFSAQLTMLRISTEAAKLRFQKGLRVYTKPIASSEMTIRRVGPSFLQRSCQSVCFSFFSKIQHGLLTISFPDGSTHEFGRDDGTLRAHIRVANYDFFMKSVFSGDVGFGEAYVDGHWDTEDLGAVLNLFILNERTLDEGSVFLSKVGNALNWAFHRMRRNTRAGSQKNIHAHYDLSNELFQSFLDDSMLYSCAIYQSEHESLADAQRNKVRAMIEKVQLGPDDHLLEIGSGWGALAIQAAQETGCRVTSITLSEQQLDLARKKATEAGVSDRVTFQLRDYRDMSGTFDKIISIEMIEAVGHDFLGTFFAACERMLKPDGVLALQVITMPETQYQQYRKSCDWVQKYIFPGGLCPSIQAMVNAMSVESSFVVQEIDAIGTHYARTLRDWRCAFNKNFSSLCSSAGENSSMNRKAFDERFRRMWNYYLSYCESGFAMRKIDTLQLVLSRAKNRSLPSCPGYKLL